MTKGVPVSDLVARVAAEAVSIRPLKALLTVLAFPFYVLGLVLGLVVVAVIFAVGAVKLGVADMRARVNQPPAVGES